MNKILILFLLIINFSFGQSESREYFSEALNLPSSKRFSNDALGPIAIKHRIQGVKFFKDNKLITELIFDEMGNVVEKINSSDNKIEKTKYYYDELNRLIQYTLLNDEEVKYDVRYSFDGPIKTMYINGDSIPHSREIVLTDENVEIYSEYDEEKGWILQSMTIKDSKDNFVKGLRFNSDGLYSEIQYFMDPTNQEGGTNQIGYHNGKKTYEKLRSMYKTDSVGNRIEKYSAYSEDSLKLISKHKFNLQHQILENQYLHKIESFDYDTNGILTKKTVEDKNGLTKLFFLYNKTLPYKVEKLNGKDKITYLFKYEYFK